MVSGLYAWEDGELERLHAQARRYDLLSRQEERDIDRRKWAAIKALLALLVNDPYSRHYLLRWARQCGAPLPDIASFARREHYLLLRRELADYLPGGNRAAELAALVAGTSATTTADTLVADLLALSLPASFVVGMAEAVSPRRTHSPIATALQAWERTWPEPSATDVPARKRSLGRSLAEQIGRYTAARDLLIKHNLRLVFAIAARQRGRAADFLDLVQEGNLGLLRAAEKFQFQRGYRFSTYAFNWITQGVQRHLARSTGAIRHPSHVQEQLGRLHGERNRRLARAGIVPGDRELADALGLSIPKVRELLQLSNFSLSLDAPRFEEESGETLLDTIAGGPFADPAAAAERMSLQRQLLLEIGRLDEAEQQVVTRRWGLLRHRPSTRAEIAEQMSVSREWVRRLEQSALEKLGQSAAIYAAYQAQSRDRNPEEEY